MALEGNTSSARHAAEILRVMGKLAESHRTVSCRQEEKGGQGAEKGANGFESRTELQEARS